MQLVLGTTYIVQIYWVCIMWYTDIIYTRCLGGERERLKSGVNDESPLFEDLLHAWTGVFALQF